ncbi:MAG: hypothetical protein FDX30_10490 [Chlorobium sp.]|nr:MAG: hypothetical protein FDX30_10490 [Chlorobium sp.]
MKRNILSALLAFTFLLYNSLSYAALNQITGNWRNADPNTRGITTLAITGNGNSLRMHAWGKCHPQDCDWGEVDANAYAPNVSSPLEPSANAISAVFATGFSQTLVIVRPAGNNTVRAEVFTRFTDGSGRSNYTEVYTFNRQMHLMPLHPVQPIQPVQPVQPVQPIQPVRPIRPIQPLLPQVQEDCLSFNPATASVRNIDGRWTIVDGNHLMFNFGDKRMEALQALKIIKYYRMNSSCFVGRPDPSFQYLLVNGQAPQGNLPGEDCVSFNPNTSEVKNIGGRWKIVDGSHWVFDFGDKEGEARTAFAIIRKYGFTFVGYVGRPNASFIYLRK